MSTYHIENHFPKVGETILQSGMTLRSGDIEGPCDEILGKLYIYPGTGDQAKVINVGEEVEIVSQERNTQLLQRRKDAIYHRQLSWQEQIGEENTRSFDPSNESW